MNRIIKIVPGNCYRLELLSGEIVEFKILNATPEGWWEIEYPINSGNKRLYEKEFKGGWLSFEEIDCPLK
ncbi:MAG: hypothetical protein H8D23_13235 [Candidatus Brocadiales bacterium]|nr:hypothetical protein [Candidatus Brocadiales bacterium]